MIIKIIVIVVGLIFAAVFGYGSYAFRRRLKELQSIELVPIAELEEGRRKTTGEVVALEKLIRAPISGTKCVWYSIVMQEEREREETYTETVGNRRITRTRTRTDFVQIFSDAQCIAFNIQDDTGDAEIDMNGAEAIIKSKERWSKGRVRDLTDKAISRLEDAYPDNTKILGKRCHYVETFIEEGDTLLVLGEVTLSKNKPPLFAPEKKKSLLVSDRSDEQLQKSFKTTSLWLGIGAAAFLVATILGGIFIGGK